MANKSKMLSLFSNLYKFSLPRISRSERTVRSLFSRFPDAEILRAIFPRLVEGLPFSPFVVVYDVQTLIFIFFATYRVQQVGFPILGGKMASDFYVCLGFDLVSAGESICLHANK